MDLNVNKLPESEDSRLKPNTPEPAPLVTPEPRDSNALVKVAAFLAIVVVLTGLAINSHYQGSQPTMASDTPPAVSSSTMPAATAPTERATTGSGSTAPTIAPNPPSEAAEGKNSNQ
ncbi:MAG: hypothetical protein Q7T81_10600 [Pseudolabrys sp.]|nr:hypothetical protein [Pseudolabrys sp.]